MKIMQGVSCFTLPHTTSELKIVSAKIASNKTKTYIKYKVIANSTETKSAVSSHMEPFSMIKKKERKNTLRSLCISDLAI